MLFETEIEINALRAYHSEKVTHEEAEECGLSNRGSSADDNSQGIQMRSFSESSEYEGGYKNDDDK